MPHRTRRPLVDEQSRLVAPPGRPLRDQLGRQLVLELGGLHPAATLPSRWMDDDAVKRAMERIASASESRPTEADVQAALERAREQIESLALVAAELEETLPQRVGDAVKEGVREQAQPLGRQTAEVRGLLNRLIRQTERLESDLLAERNARVDDLALLVELITSGWRGVDEKIAALTERFERIDDRVAQLGSVDERMARIENAFGRLEKALTDRSGAVVYRIEERRTS